MNSQLMTTESGEYRMMSFKEDLMSRLYEKFVFEYYRQHFRDTFYVSSKQIHWNIEDDLGIPFLPQMQSDIMLINKANDKTLIIDTKYYLILCRQIMIQNHIIQIICIRFLPM